MDSLEQIVRDRDLAALEAYCIEWGTYRRVVENAVEWGVDLGELEELLAEL